MPSLLDEVRIHAAAVMADALDVTIDEGALAAYHLEPADHPDPAHRRHGDDEDTARFVLALDAINFGSGWFGELRKRPGRSGYDTIAEAFAEAWPLSADELAGIDAATVARLLGQDRGLELMDLYAQALRDLGGLLQGFGGSAGELVASAQQSAERLARLLVTLPAYQDRGFYKRAQITANDLAAALDGAPLGRFDDLDRLTIFADNLVPHVLRTDGVLRYSSTLEAHLRARRPVAAGSRTEIEIRAGAVHAGELLATRIGIAAREVDWRLWARGNAERYRNASVPRHRTRTPFY